MRGEPGAILAAKALDANAPLLTSSDEREQKRPTAILNKVVKNYPTTRAAAQAKELQDVESTANQSDR